MSIFSSENPRYWYQCPRNKQHIGKAEISQKISNTEADRKKALLIKKKRVLPHNKDIIAQNNSKKTMKKPMKMNSSIFFKKGIDQRDMAKVQKFFSLHDSFFTP